MESWFSNFQETSLIVVGPYFEWALVLFVASAVIIAAVLIVSEIT